MKISKIAIIGSGTMGQGIAQWFAQQNIQVELIDIKKEYSEKALINIFSSWERLSKKGKFSQLQIDQFKENIIIKDLEEIDPQIDLVIEAIIEDLNIKRQVFKKLNSICDEHTVFASNTSSIPISDISNELPNKRQENFIGIHFFNPAPIMKLVEIIIGKNSSPDLGQNIAKWFDQHKKVPAICKDRPGFIVNRVARNFYGEPLRIVENFDPHKIENVDQVLKTVGGFRMGPFELMDLIGIDVNYMVTESVYSAFDKNPRFAPHPLQKEMVDKKRNGKKSGKGFYDYE
ncbi:MAG: 3-hydroxyacyl-CoA dehydrogenase family protein [Bacteriovoracaceae bacterium]